VAAQLAGGFVFVALTGLALRAPLWALLAATLLAGACIVGGLNSLVALTTVFYPASMCSTAVGWTLGVGRVGGIVGPLVVGAALAAEWPGATVVCVMAFPMIAAGLGILLLGRRYGRRRGTAAATRSG
jgi:MFS transporter, AAHS family, 4-hydroxybenzoate transporter